MSAVVRQTDPKPGSRQWRWWAGCTTCGWWGYRFANRESADRQAEKHNDEKHGGAA